MKSLDSLRLADIATRRVLGVSPDCPLPLAARRMGETRVSCLAIVEDARPIGILTERDLVELLHRRADPATVAAAVMREPVITAPAELDFGSAYRMLRQHGIRHLLAVDAEGGLAGVATATDFRFHLGLDGFRRIHGLRTVLDPVTAALPPEAPLADALERMVREMWDYVLVVKDQHPLGILTERDMPLLLAAQVDPSEIQLREVMSAPVQSISTTATVAEASARMARLHIRHLAVVNESQRLVGMLSQDSLLEKLGVEVLTAGEPGWVGVDDASPGSADHVARILEATRVGIWEWACCSGHCVCSRTLGRMLGFPDDWQPGSLDGWTERIHPDDRGLFLEALHAAKAGGSSISEVEVRLRRYSEGWIRLRTRFGALPSDTAAEDPRVVATIAEAPPFE